MTQFFSNTSSKTFDEIRSTDDIFEKVISPKDVYDFFIFHQKRFWTRFKETSESWTFESNHCEIKAISGKNGNTCYIGCIGCVLTCRLLLDCTFPNFFPGAKVYKIEYPRRNVISAMTFYKRSESETEKFRTLFRNNSTLTYLLDEVGSGGGILFSYKCQGSIILVCESANDLGFGFNGFIHKEKSEKLTVKEVEMFVKRLESIDKILKENKFFFLKLSDDNIAITDDPCGNLSVKLFPGEQDKIYPDKPESEYKSICEYAKAKGIKQFLERRSKK